MENVDRNIVFGFTLYDDFDFSVSLFYSGLNSLTKKNPRKLAKIMWKSCSTEEDHH